jgi:hypothetical protein
MYRTLDAVWQFPSELVPKGSQRHEGSGSMRSPLGYDKRRDVWELQLKVRRRMTPVQLAFALHLPGVPACECFEGQGVRVCTQQNE